MMDFCRESVIHSTLALANSKREKVGMLNEMSLLPLDLCNQMGSNKAHNE